MRRPVALADQSAQYLLTSDPSDGNRDLGDTQRVRCGEIDPAVRPVHTKRSAKALAFGG